MHANTFNDQEMMKHKYLLGYVMTALLSLIACTGDVPDMQTDVVTARCVIRSRAAGDLQPETLPNELINNWWVAFVDGSGTVRRIVGSSPQLTVPVEHDEFTVDLPASTYTLYAFANLSMEQLRDRTGLQFVTGEKVGPDVAGAVWEDMENNPDTSAPVPMSGTATVNFRNGYSGFTVEVVRMLAKVRISVRNASTSPFGVRRLSFGLLNRGPVPLRPDYTALGSCPDILEPAREQHEELKFDDIDEDLNAGGSMSHTFYVRESSAIWTHPACRYFVTFGVGRPDGSVAEEHYAITDDLQWIQRNDFIDIPIVISDMTVDWSVLFYPPIGGYPAVMTEADGDSHFMTFGTMGKFRIRPQIKDNGSIVPPSDYDFEITGIEGDRDIFTRLPAKDPVTGEIIGELASASGTAVLECTITVRADGYETVRSRRIYIIRK